MKVTFKVIPHPRDNSRSWPGPCFGFGEGLKLGSGLECL